MSLRRAPVPTMDELDVLVPLDEPLSRYTNCGFRNPVPVVLPALLLDPVPRGLLRLVGVRSVLIGRGALELLLLELAAGLCRSKSGASVITKDEADWLEELLFELFPLEDPTNAELTDSRSFGLLACAIAKNKWISAGTCDLEYRGQEDRESQDQLQAI